MCAWANLLQLLQLLGGIFDGLRDALVRLDGALLALLPVIVSGRKVIKAIRPRRRRKRARRRSTRRPSSRRKRCKR
jgi:hypothetical protein